MTLLLVAALACAEHSHPAQLEPPAVRPDGIVAYLVATPSSVPNEYVVRALTRHGIAVEDPGSFVAALELTSPSVRFISDASDAQSLRALASENQTVRIAGAAPEGLANGELFALRLRAVRARDINSVRLELSEINDRSGASLRSSLVVLPHVSWTAPR